jgi:carboxylesterase 2
MQFSNAVLAGFVWSSTVLKAVAQNAPTVTVSSGPIQGTALASNVKAFLGIPFAQSPPVRFGAPVDPKPWTASLKATAFKPACVQQFSCKLKVLSVGETVLT